MIPEGDDSVEDPIRRKVEELMRPEVERLLAQLADPTSGAADPPSAPTPEEAAQAADRLESLGKLALAAGVRPGAVPDFVARVERDLATTPSTVDPTLPHAGVDEFAATLKLTAPHLFGTKLPGNGRAPASNVLDAILGPWK